MKNELVTRIVSGVILAGAVLFITAWHPTSFAVMCAIGGVVLWKEWRGLTRARGLGWVVIGAVYILAVLTSLIALRYRPEGLYLIYLLFALVWAGDIGGFVAGKLFGKHKIAPTISPGKSWEGLVGAILVTGLVLYGISTIGYARWPAWVFFLIGTVISVIGLAGDMFESSLKRHAGVKDSGKLIPGHGGLFDRVDALMPVAILFGALYFLLPLLEGA